MAPQRYIRNISSANEEGRKEGKVIFILASSSRFSALLFILLATFLLNIYYVQSHSPAVPHLVFIAALGTLITHPCSIGEENEIPNRLGNFPISEAATW